MTDSRFRILTVCTGNICRSPVAERLLTKSLGDEVTVASAGVHAALSAPPVIEPMVTEEAVAEVPAEAPVAEAPAVETPAAEAPVAEAPAADAPAEGEKPAAE